MSGGILVDCLPGEEPVGVIVKEVTSLCEKVAKLEAENEQLRSACETIAFWLEQRMGRILSCLRKT